MSEANTTRGRKFVVAAATLAVLAASPCAAQAHGPVAPIASSYLAVIGYTPVGLEAKTVDGDQRMWLRVDPRDTVVVLDYRGAPYLRFSPAGVAVNQDSEMYYLNQTPIAETPPADLTATTRPNWQQVSHGHVYGWHDGRLHALATVALSPGTDYVGRWRVPVRIDGRPTAITGALLHSPNPSLVWFWPIVVLLACVLAARRVRRPSLDDRVAHGLAVAALIAFATAGLGRELHGRPTVTGLQLTELGLMLAFAVWGLWRVLVQQPGYFSYFVISFVALWEGVELIPTLVYGYVLMAVPAFIARTSAVLCLGAGAGVLLLVFRLAENSRGGKAGAGADAFDAGDGDGDDSALELV